MIISLMNSFIYVLIVARSVVLNGMGTEWGQVLKNGEWGQVLKEWGQVLNA